MANKHDIQRDTCQLVGGQARQGYDWWWHSFTGHHAETGEEKAFFIEFFVCNPALGGDAPILGQLPENKEKGLRPSYLMVKCGSWGRTNRGQLHRYFGWNQARVEMGCPFEVEADDCLCNETHTHGRVQISQAESQAHPEWLCDHGTMSWDLKINKVTAFNVGFGAGSLFRRLQLFEMFWHAEGMATEYEGEVIWNGERYLIRPQDCYGYSDKNWGRDFTSPWVWLSSCNITSLITGQKLEGAVFDIGGGRPKCGPIVLDRKLLSDMWYKGKSYEFNFSKFWTFCRTKFDCHETETQIVWHVDQRTWTHRMVTDIVCDKDEMLLVNYEAPTGLWRHRRLWNGGTGHGTVELYHGDKLLDRMEVKNVGCEWGEYCHEG